MAHVLSGGFERIGFGLEQLDANRKTISDPVEVPAGHIDLDPTSFGIDGPVSRLSFC
jgi:hypothetical protein